MYGWAGSTLMFLVAIGVNSFWSLAGPTSQSLMTQRVSPSEQGELQGAIASLRGIAMVIGPTIFSTTFAYFIAPEHRWLGAPWYLAASMLVVSLVIAAAVAKGRDQNTVGTTMATAEGPVG
jgi:DHA1 family tetracycline resistance protein-like MFS transporter